MQVSSSSYVLHSDYMSALERSGKLFPGQGSTTSSELSPGAAEMPFLVSTGVEKPNPEARKFIRSHVMMGKNQGRTRRLKLPGARESAENHNSNNEGLSGLSSTLGTASRSVIPPKIGSDLSTVRFADAVEPYMVDVVLRCESDPSSHELPRSSNMLVSAVDIAHIIHNHTSLLHR